MDRVTEVNNIESGENSDGWSGRTTDTHGFMSLRHLMSRVLISDSVHSWQLYIAIPLGIQDIGTMTQYPTHHHYIDTELTNICPILLMPSTRKQCVSML